MNDSKNAPSRRGMLAALGLTGAAAATLSVLPGKQADSAAVQPAKQPSPEKGGGYALTEHVKRYYQTTLI